MITMSRMKSAVTCYEEVILANPINHNHYIRYAELCYSLSNFESYKLARKNFAYAYEIQANSRSLYGIVQSCIALSATKQGKGDKENESIFQWSLSQLTDLYKTKNTSTMPLLQAYLRE